MALEKHMLQTHSLFEKAGEVFEGVTKLKERIAELEAERDSFEKSFNEMTEAFMKSQRALWIARANRAIEKIAWFKLWDASISTMNPEDGARQEFDKWKKALGKFLSKVEEYK